MKRPRAPQALSPERSPRRQGALLYRDAPGKERKIEEREDDRDRPGAEGEGEERDLAGDDEVVGMTQETIGTAPHQSRAGQRDDARRPEPPERRDDPEAQ